MTTLAFVDTETTGLDPDLHEIWEVGLILRQPYEPASDDANRTPWIEGTYTWQLPVDLGRADPIALNIGHFHDRRADPSDLTHPATFAKHFAEVTRGAHLVGAVISFDEERLRRLLRAEGECPMWHYHLVDVEALAAGFLAHRDPTTEFSYAPPWDSGELSHHVGIDVDQFDRHTAIGDARWARAIYDAVMGVQATGANA